MKRLYEALFLFSSREDLYNKDLEAVKAIIADLGLEITKEQDLGVKELAYPIAKQSKGRYHLINISSIPPIIQKLRNELKLQETMLRYLIIEIMQKDVDFMERKAKMVPRERPFKREGSRYDSYRRNNSGVRDFTKPYSPSSENNTQNNR